MSAFTVNDHRMLTRRNLCLRDFTGLAAKGRNSWVCRPLYPWEDVGPDYPFARRTLTQPFPCWVIGLRENQAPKSAMQLSRRHPWLTLPALESSPHAAPGPHSTLRDREAAKTTSCSLRNKHTSRHLKFPMILFLPNVTSSFLTGREAFVGQQYPSWDNVTYER